MKFAFITGINGQDGSYLAELLLKKNYVVHGLIRRCSQINTQRIDHILDKLILHYGDVTDISCVMSIFNDIKNKNPSVIEIYNLAAMSHVKVSFEIPEFTSQASGTSVLNILEAIRQTNIQEDEHTKLFSLYPLFTSITSRRDNYSRIIRLQR